MDTRILGCGGVVLDVGACAGVGVCVIVCVGGRVGACVCVGVCVGGRVALEGSCEVNQEQAVGRGLCVPAVEGVQLACVDG